MCRFAGIVLVVGCGSVSAKQPDAAIDAPADAPLPAATHYVADRIYVPTNNTEARQFGLDINGDGTVDNQLGMVLATLSGMGFTIQADNAAALDHGAAITLFDVATFGYADSAYAQMAVLVGNNPLPAACTDANDTICRHHLTGTASFGVTPTGATLMAGAFSAGTGIAGPGRVTVQLTFIGAASPVLFPLIGARVKLATASATSIGSVVVGGAVTMTDVDMKVIPGMRDQFAPIVARDCTMLTSPPGCGCVADSTGKTLLGLFDTTPKDCAISEDEIRNNSLIVALLAPDVMIEGQPALSVGVGFTAVGATFSYP